MEFYLNKSLKYVDTLLEQLDRDILFENQESNVNDYSLTEEQERIICEHIKTNPKFDNIYIYNLMESLGITSKDVPEILYNILHNWDS